MIYNNVLDLVGHTPVVKYENIYIKLEGYNPGGSIKDRAAKYMLIKALERGDIKCGDTIVEPTSGNTGIGLACLGPSLGLKVVIIMPDNMSVERIKAIKAYGAEVILTDGSLGMKGAIDLANKLVKEKNYHIMGQFDNPDNALAHYETTAEEIISDFKTLDYIVCSIGSGGTITGLSKRLKEVYPNIKVIGVEPEESPLLSKGYAGSHKIQGIGANFIPSLLDTSCYDKIITVKSDDCFIEMQKLAEKGLFLGISSAAAVIAAKSLGKGNILAISPDSGLKYLSVIK